MFEELHQQDAQRPAGRTDGEPLPDPVGAGPAQRSEPERSDGARSGAGPAPTASAGSMSPSTHPPISADRSGGPGLDADQPDGDACDVDAESNIDADERQDVPDESFAAGLPRLTGRRRGKPGRRLVPFLEERTVPLTAEQRLLLLDTWLRSGLPAGDFASLVGMSKHTLYAWKKRFDADGPAGLRPARQSVVRAGAGGAARRPDV